MYGNDLDDAVERVSLVASDELSESGLEVAGMATRVLITAEVAINLPDGWDFESSYGGSTITVIKEVEL